MFDVSYVAEATICAAQRSQIDSALSNSRLCSPYVISFDVPKCSLSPRERMSDDDKHLENFYCGGL